MKGARLGGLLARGLILGAAAVIVVVATLLTWPWSVDAPSPDQLRTADLQRLSHAIAAFRARQHVLPASLARLPVEPAAPFHIYDPVTHRPYDYRPLGPLAYELCARFDAADPEERRDFWWHDAGRHCFSLETRQEPKPPAASPDPTAPVPSATLELGVPEPTPSQTTPDSAPTPSPPLAPSGPPPPAEPPTHGGAAAPPGAVRQPLSR